MDHEANFAYIGHRAVWGGQKELFGLANEDRRHHTYVIGKSGSGKTTLLRNLILQDIEAGRGVGVIDPHGDLAEEILDHIPPWRTDHLTYFNPADEHHPVGFNPFQSDEKSHLIASGLVGAFKSVWRDSWGPRLEYILYATLAALVERENTSLLGVQRMLTDKRYRAWVLGQVEDPMVRSFWQNEFERYDPKFLQEAIAPIQNKVGQLLMAAPTRNVFGQIKSRFDARFQMDNERIFIANLSKGKLGEDKSNLLGAMLVTQFQLAAMSRADTPENDRKDFALFVDEFHNFATDSFSGILSEARKYRLCLTLSHQYIGQLRQEIKDAVFGNVGNLISFRVGHSDAAVLEKEFGAEYAARNFTQLGNHEVCAKLLDGGRHGEPFFGKTLPPWGKPYGRKENMIRRSREKYATNREIVEDKIQRWMSNQRTGK